MYTHLLSKVGSEVVGALFADNANDVEEVRDGLIREIETLGGTYEGKPRIAGVHGRSSSSSFSTIRSTRAEV
jgi:hypothetical protein